MQIIMLCVGLEVRMASLDIDLDFCTSFRGTCTKLYYSTNFLEKNAMCSMMVAAQYNA